MKKDIKKKEFLNGEFIPSYYAWKTQEEQKKIVERLENITKTNKKED